MGDQIARREDFEKRAEKKSAAGASSVPNSMTPPTCSIKPPMLSSSPNHWDQAGSAYVKLANCHLKLDSKHEAAGAYASAAHCYKKTNTKETISCLEQAVNMFKEIGRLNMAARYYKEIAESYEAEQNFEQAIFYYEKRLIFSKAKIWNRYQQAIEIYEDIARQSLNNNLLKYGVKGHLLNAGIGQLCKGKGDTVAINNALEKYQDLADAIDQEDIAKFTDAVKEFDSMTQLDAWKTTLLLRVKEALKAKELEEDDLT
ncbi:unnamed protein product [Camellia sinensis]